MNTALVPGTASLVSCNATAAGAVALTSDAVMATPSGDERNAFVDSPSTPPSPASVPLLPPSSLFYGTNLASPSLRRLEKIADALLAGSWNSMDHFRAICETEGYPCDMAVVLEARAARSMMCASKERAALDGLRSIEARFDEWMRERILDGNSQEGRVTKYLAAAESRGVRFRPRDPSDLQSLDRLLILHEFLMEEPRVRENYTNHWTYSFMGDFLAENDKPHRDGGCCYPMMLLAVQLGRRAGLPLSPVWSERHVSVFADIGEGLLYEPSWSLRADGTVNVSKVLFPPETHVLGYRAPRHTLVGLSDLVINQSLTYQIVADFSQGRDREAVRNLWRLANLVPQLPPTQMSLANRFASTGEEDWAEKMAQSALTLFPQLLSAHLILVKVHLMRKDFDKALESLKAAAVIMMAKERRAEKTEMPILLPSLEDEIRFFFYSGQYHEAKSNLDQALESYRLAFRKIPGENHELSLPTRNALIRLQKRNENT